MADLFDEIENQASTGIATDVRNIGGDLLDEAGFKTKNTGLISPRVSAQPADDERRRQLDKINEGLSNFERFAVGAGRGLTTLARGVGLAEPEDPATRQAFQSLAAESLPAQLGEIVGEAAPFLASAPLAGAGLAMGARTLIPPAARLSSKIAAGGTVGAIEGGIIAGGRDGDLAQTVAGAGTGGAVAGVSEIIFPIIGRLGSAVFSRLGRTPEGPLLTPEGRPTPEFQQALTESNTSFDDLTAQAFAQVNRPGVDPAQAARAGRFEAQQIPATTGDITQQFTQQAQEQRLISQAASGAGEPLRQVKLQQSEAFKDRTRELIDTLGVPAETGETLKSALTGRKKLLKEQKNALYKQVAETAPEVANVPLVTDTIKEAIPKGRELRRLSRLAGSQVKAVEDLLVEFGIETDEQIIKRSGLTPEDVTPLNLGNFEEFRQALNIAERADATGAAKVVTIPIKNALDAEAGLVDEAVQRVGISDVGVLNTLRQARQRVRDIKTEFSPQAIAGRLIDVKRDGVTPVIEASKVSQELLRPTAPIENLKRTVASLRQSGKEGIRGIKDLQASVVLNALEASLKASSRKTGGVPTVGGTEFAKSLAQFGDDKLRTLFAGNKQALDKLLNLKQTALDITPTAAATPKGSAPVILDIISGSGALPHLAPIRNTIRFIVSAGGDERAVRRAINAKPVFKRTVTALERDFPALASSLGIAGVLSEREREEQR